jgi:transcriptional regulator with XRE-family HTH domain
VPWSGSTAWRWSQAAGREETCSARDSGVVSRMGTNTNKLVKPRLTARRATDELRQVVCELNTETTLRDLADRVGVCHNTLWKFLKRKRMRLSTIRRIRDGLARADGATAFDQFLSGLRGLLDPLNEAKGRKAERAAARALAVWFTDEGERVPVWVMWLARGQRKLSPRRVDRLREALLQAPPRGQRKQSRHRVERAHPAIAQVPSKVPAGRR